VTGAATRRPDGALASEGRRVEPPPAACVVRQGRLARRLQQARGPRARPPRRRREGPSVRGARGGFARRAQRGLRRDRRHPGPLDGRTPVARRRRRGTSAGTPRARALAGLVFVAIRRPGCPVHHEKAARTRFALARRAGLASRAPTPSGSLPSTLVGARRPLGARKNEDRTLAWANPRVARKISRSRQAKPRS